jgi:hypothetical protein
LHFVRCLTQKNINIFQCVKNKNLDQSVNEDRQEAGLAPRPAPSRYGAPWRYCAAAQASRNCLFITLPLALRGSGSAVSTIVSGTL